MKTPYPNKCAVNLFNLARGAVMVGTTVAIVGAVVVAPIVIEAINEVIKDKPQGD